MFEVVQEAYQVKYYIAEQTNKDDLLYLSIFVSNHNFQYAIFTNEYKVIVELADVELKHSQLGENNPLDLISLLINNNFLNQKKFEKVNICILNNQFTLLPEAFAEQTDINDLLGFTTGINQNFKVQKHKTKYCNFCYAILNDWLDYFGKTFPNASIKHAGAISVSLLFEHFSLLNTQLMLEIHHSQIEICSKSNNQLVFYNVFSFETKEDILYFLLFTMEQLQLNPLMCHLTIAGELDTNSEIIMNIKKYVKQVDYCVLDTSLSFKNLNNTLPHHYYFTLLNQHLCAL